MSLRHGVEWEFRQVGGAPLQGKRGFAIGPARTA
jgi:hypothetical protein